MSPPHARRVPGVLLLALLLLAAALAPASAGAATDADTVWLCHPAMQDDPCDGSLTTTVQQADGTSTVQQAPVPAKPGIDCFYVYPTVSNQTTPNATKTADPEVKSIATYQAARFSQQCRVFAPVYRQNTLVSIFSGGFTDATRAIAYGDVLGAWNDYLRNDNKGRGVVLIGHSQGTGMLRKLVREEIDPDPAARKRLVSALLIGGNVTVKKGSDRGGDFKNVPLCRLPGQLACVVAFSTFLDDPPADSRFGRPPTETDRLTGLPPRTDVEVACTNPGSLTANEQAPAKTFVPSRMFAPGGIAVGILAVYGGLPPSAATPWVQPADRYSGRCETINGAHVLKVRQLGSARHLNAFPDAGWGLHLVDVNGALGNLQDIVAAQSATYLRPRVGLSLVPGRTAGRRCVGRAVTVRLTGADAGLTRRVDYLLRGVVIARDTKAPFAVRIVRSRLKRGRANTVTARVTLKDGRARTLVTSLRRCA
ncbi:MAG: hypothetical protein JWP18_304 [Solirubrobacterales bacterium]|nr:hypothetical protein [Solirubrobacterales bacterium]